MTRITRSAQTLVTQILDRYPDAAIRNGEEPDGLGVHRVLIVEEPVAEPLFNLLVPIAQTDRRIEGIKLADDLTITFVSDRYADYADPFPLHAVEAVQNEAGPGEDGPSGDSKPKVDEPPTEDPKGPEGDSKPAKKAAAKKADS